MGVVVKVVSSGGFGEEVRGGVAVVDFSAEGWCGPCRALAPVLEELSDELKGVKFVKVDVDGNEGLAAEWDIRSVPTLVLLKDGREVDRVFGVSSKEALRERLRGLA